MMDCVVIGAGVIGLAIARRLARAGREVVIVEAGAAIGSETSARNSEVIHAGIYYPAGSLKARLCVAGRAALYRYCERRGVPKRRCGKLIVAADEPQLPGLDTLLAKARANGVDDLRLLTRNEALSLEPALSCAGALLSPSTGIVDSHQLMLSYLGEAEAAGAVLALHAPVLGGRRRDDHWRIRIGGPDPDELATRMVVNAAGLGASAVAASLGLAPAAVPATYLAKGNYFTLTGGRPPFSRLIYPLPEPGGLGVHVTLDLGGRVRFGPDVEWVDHLSYDVDPARGDRFYAAIRRYYPALRDGALAPGYSGIRPKLARQGEADADFRIDGPAAHGAPGLVNLFGIESPGLTASLAIAEMAAKALAVDPDPTDADLWPLAEMAPG